MEADTGISIHALLAESDNAMQIVIVIMYAFLSTLSLRRATRLWTILYSCPGNFYPRSPCGERPYQRQIYQKSRSISIHALLAESDNGRPVRSGHNTNFYPRSPCGERQQAAYFFLAGEIISIHALLAESDPPRVIRKPTAARFLSTLSLRRATVLVNTFF